MNILINILKILVIIITSFFFIQRAIRETQTLDFAVWNDFKIKETDSKFKNFQDSQVSYSKSLNRFFILNKRIKGKIKVKFSRRVDIFEPNSSSTLRFYSLFKLKSKERPKIFIDNKNNVFRLLCSNSEFRISLLNSTNPSGGITKREQVTNSCFKFTNLSNIRMAISERPLLKDHSASLKHNLEIELLMRKHNMHKIIFAQKKHDSLFLVGIDSERFFIFQIKGSQGKARKIGTLPIEGTFPFASILKCSTKSNCLNIKLFYNKFNKIYFLYIPPKHLLMIYRKYQTLVSKFSGFSMKSLNNMKIHIDRNLLISRVFTSPENEQPYLEINLFKYNISQKRYRVIQERLNYVNFADSYSEISKLATFDHTGQFDPKSNKNVFSDTVITSPSGNSKMICLFLQNKRIVCSMILYNFRKPNSEQHNLQDYLTTNAKALLVLTVVFLSVRIFFWKKTKTF